MLQYIGLVFCAAGVGVLAGGYDRGWMGNTALCWVCLVLCLIGLLFHEFRPFNVSSGGNQWRCLLGLLPGLPGWRACHIQRLPTAPPNSSASMCSHAQAQQLMEEQGKAA